MPVRLTNNAVSTMTTAVSTTDTTITVPAGHGVKFPALSAGDWFPLTLVDANGNMEIVKATARAGDVLTIARAQEGTTARAFNIGAVVSHRATAASLEALRTEAVDQTARDAANSAQATADTAKSTANAAKSSADSSVKTVNGVAPVGGNVQVDVPTPNPDTPNSVHNAIGSFIFALLNSGMNASFGQVISGSVLLPASAAGSTLGSSYPVGVGSWRSHGYVKGASGNPASFCSLFQRIA